MKPTPLRLLGPAAAFLRSLAASALLLLATVFAAVAGNAFAASAPAASAAKAAALTHERVELKVTKVFAARDGEAQYRAYQVEWNGQEIVIDDTLAQTNYRVGDVITVLVLRQPAPAGREARELLQFVLGPPRREPTPPAKDAKAKR